MMVCTRIKWLFAVLISVCLISSAYCFRLPHSTPINRNGLTSKGRFHTQSHLSASLPTKTGVQTPSLNLWKRDVKSKTVQQSSKLDIRRWIATFSSTLIVLVKTLYSKSRQIIEGAISGEPSLPLQPYQSFLLWASIFVFTTLFYCAENAIGKISPWTAKQYAEEEV